MRTVKFESGYAMNLDTAVRNAVRTGVHQMQAKMMDENIRQTGVEYVYVSKHWGARNKGTGHANHEAWQGKVYAVAAGDHAGEAERIGYHTIEDLYEATGYSADGRRENDPLGLHGYNCRHSHRPWFAGISNLSDFPEDPEPAPVTIGGKTYDYYAITQKMRRMERGVRVLKKEREALRAMELDTKDIDYKIRRRTEAYKDFCKAAKVKEKTERLRYECSRENLGRSKAWKEIRNAEQSIEKSTDSGIIEDDKGTLKMKLQFFAEEDIYRQESGSLKRAIRKYEKRVREHEDYLKEPEKHCADWDEKSIEEKEGLKRHWNKEIRNFKQSIKDREEELRKRGDYDDD